MFKLPSTIRLTGVSYNNGQENIRTFAKPDIRWFAMVREPENPHDKNAIRVALFGEFFLGYIPKDVAAHLAPLMDAGRVFDAEYVYVNRHPIHDMVGLTVKIVEAPSPAERRSEIWEGETENGAKKSK